MTRRAAVVAALVVLAAACSGAGGGHGPVTLTLVTHDSFAATQSVLDQFTAQTGIKLDVPKGVADAGVVLNKAILTKGRPEGDVLWGVDNTLLSRAVQSGAFVAYHADALEQVGPAFRTLVPGGELTPVDYGDVCVNFDRAWYARKGVAPPRTFDDLRSPTYKGQLVVENPATSSPGLVFLLATVARYGPEGWQQYWKDLRRNGVKVVDGWTQAYSGAFSGSAGKGPSPLVVSYGSSPPAEVGDAQPPSAQAPTGVLADTCFRQVEFVGILAGTAHEKEARRLVEFLLGQSFQQDMPLNMYVYPVRAGVALPALFQKYAVVPARSLSLPPDDIAANRDRWIAQWTTVVLH
jgi:thiamine transport system substrate-binding protein